MAEVDIDSKLNYEAEYSKYLKNVKKKGNSIQANCPFHKGGNEKKPSFSVDLKTGRKFIGFELNSEYFQIAKKRVKDYLMQKLLSKQSNDIII